MLRKTRLKRTIQHKKLGASMRPQRNAAENAVAQEGHALVGHRFNEAAA